MAKKITVTSDNALVSAAIEGIVSKAFNVYCRTSEREQKQFCITGYDADRICIPALEAVVNSVVSPKVYSIISEEIEEPQED